MDDLNPGGGFYVDDPIALILLIVLLVPFLLLLLLLAVEWLLVLLLLPVLAVVRVLLPMPWTVVARPTGRTVDPERYAAEIRGWRASRRGIREAAEEIRRYGRPRRLPLALVQRRFKG